MDTLEQNSQDALCAEILAEARQEAEQLLGHARQEADALLTQARLEAERLRQQRLAAARSEAARRREVILATVPVEAGRERSAAIEALLQRIREQARQQLAARGQFDYHASLITLAAEAISRMTGDTFIVRLPAAERITMADGLAEAIINRVGRSPLSITVLDDPAVSDGGLVVQDAEGRQFCDEHLEARLERLWPELRREIALRIALVGSQTTGAAP